MKLITPLRIKEFHLGVFGFLILLTLSVIFYKERICFIDTAFQFFKIVNFEKFNVELNRYTAYIAQIPLLAAIKTGAGLKTLALIFSVSYILLYFIVFLICLYPLKNKVAALTVLFVLIISTGQTFFHITTETHLVLVFSVLFYAWTTYDLKYGQPLPKYFLVSGIIILLTIFSHPVSIFTLAFVIFYIYIDTNGLPAKQKMIFIVSFAIPVYLFKMIVLKEHSYESNFITDVSFRHFFGGLFHIKSLEFFIFNVHRIYLLDILMGIALTVFYIKQRNYRKWLLLCTFYFFFFVLTLLIYSKADSRVMHERSFMPLALFITIPFLSDLIPALKPNYRLILIALILGKSFITITNKGMQQKERTTYIQNMMACNKKQGISKSIAIRNTYNEKVIGVPWALPFETLILSSMEGEPQTIITEQDWIFKNINIRQTENIFLGTNFWPVWDTKEFNKRYFLLKKENYQLVDYSGCQ